MKEFEEFLIRFDVNNKEFNAKIANMSNEVKKKFDNIDKIVLNTDKTVNKLANSFQKVNDTLKLPFGKSGLVGILGAIANVEYFRRYAIDLKNLSNSTGLSAEQLQIMGGVAKRVGLDVNNLNSLFKGLQSQLISLNTGANPEFAGALNQFGINARKSNGELRNSLDILTDIRKVMQGKTFEQQQTILSRFGISPEFVSLLKLTNQEFEKLANQSKNNILNNEQIKEAEKYNEQLQNLTENFKRLSLEIGNALLPLATITTKTLTPIVKGFTELSKVYESGVSLLFDPKNPQKQQKMLTTSQKFNNKLASFIYGLEYKFASNDDIVNNKLLADRQAFVESRNRARPPDGDNGSAFGLYQIHKDAAYDVLKRTPTNEELYNPVLNRKIRDERLRKALKMSGGDIVGALAYWHGDMPEFNQWKKTGYSEYANLILSGGSRPSTLSNTYDAYAKQSANNNINNSNVINNNSINFGGLNFNNQASATKYITNTFDDFFKQANSQNNVTSFLQAYNY